MNQSAAEHRDRVWRAFFEGKDWDENDEFKLKRELVLRSRELLPEFPHLIDDEWEKVPGQTNNGRGDLVFTDGAGRYAVVEVKFIDVARTGKTARTTRNDRRGKVWEQARKYAVDLVGRYADMKLVRAFVYTNELPGAPVVVEPDVVVDDT